MTENKARWVGGILGTCIAAYFFFYQPMKQNYDKCGTVFLCEPKP